MTKRGVRSWSRLLLGLLVLVMLLAALGAWLTLRASLPLLDGQRRAPGLTAEVSIARDAMGAPIVSGSDRNDVAYATGFVHAQDRFFQMDLLRRAGAGELAELFGERALPLDQARRLHRFRARAEQRLQTMSPAERRFIDRYVDGVNDGLHALNARPFEYLLINQAPRAWSASDSLLVVWAMYFDLQGAQEARKLARVWLNEHTDAAQRAFLMPESSQWDTTLDAPAVGSAGPAVARAAPPIPTSAPAWWNASAATDVSSAAGAAPAAPPTPNAPALSAAPAAPALSAAPAAPALSAAPAAPALSAAPAAPALSAAPAAPALSAASAAPALFAAPAAAAFSAASAAPTFFAAPDVSAAPVIPTAPATVKTLATRTALLAVPNSATVARRSLDTGRSASADFTDAVGSNNWAVAGSRSADGAAIVSDDMHLNLSLPNIWYRMALRFPERGGGGMRRMVGVTLPGAPPLIIAGSNGHMAWGFTNSYADLVDMVPLGLDAARPDEVLTPNGWEMLVRFDEKILVKGSAPYQMVVRESSFGPLREAGGRTFAIHWVAHRPDAINLQLGELESADSVVAALAVATRVGIPAQNFVAGDDHGAIGWTIAGPLVRRPTGSAVNAAVRDEAAPLTFWRDLLPAGEHPTIVNPAEGQLSTANNRQLIGRGAELIGDGGFDVGARNQQVHDDLRALGAKTDVKAVYNVALDDRARFIAPWRERAIKTLDPASMAGHPERAEFLRLLQTGWTGHASVNATGYTLARGFMWALHDLLFERVDRQLDQFNANAGMASASSRWTVPVARLLDEQPVAWLPAAYPSWHALQLAAIDRVIAQHTAGGAQLAAATWGARNTAKIAHPITGAVPALLRWLGTPPDQLPGDANMPRVAGPKFGQSERMTLTPGKEEQGLFNMPGGQSGHPLSPYFLRGHAEWVAGRPVPLLPGAAAHTLLLVK
jgi:penicillin amidase